MRTGNAVVGTRPARRYPPPLPHAAIELAPPPTLPEPQPLGASMVQVLFPIVGSIGSLVFILSNPKPITIVGGVVLMLGSLAMGVGMFITQRSGAIRSTRRNRTDYLAHVEEIRGQLRASARAQNESDAIRHPETAELLALAMDPTRRYERRTTDTDFLRMRVGAGPVPYAAPLDFRSVKTPGIRYDEVCAAAARRLAAQHSTLDGQPLAIDLRDSRVVTFVGDRTAARSACGAMLLAAASLHAPADVTIAACVAPPLMSYWQWLRWLPHARDPATARRYLAASITELQALTSGPLEELLAAARQRRRSGGAGPERRLIILIDAERLPNHFGFRIEDGDIPAADAGVTLVYLLRSPSEEPSHVDVRVRVEANGSCVVEERGEEAHVSTGHASRLPMLLGDAVARVLAPTAPPATDTDAAAKTRDFGLTQLLGATSVHELHPARRWRPHPEHERLRVPIGFGDDGRPVMLDLKESAHSGMGPHGLIVGATGSGKSELLRSLVLALAVTHHPEQLNLVMVDFKGGATFAGLASLPHSAGLITNLQDDLDLVDRARDALFGEMRRRQEILKDAGRLPSIVDYNALREAGEPLRPLPSLLVVIDEFSELLSAKPDFADLFVAMGRIGRSIGVHLLLASQKLEIGRIRGLESHLSYRIGLRTFSAAESREAIGVPDAYELPALPGLGYLKVDTTIFTRFQAAYVGRPYDPDPATRRETVRLSVGLKRFTAYNAPDTHLPSPTSGTPKPANSMTELQVIVAALAPAARPAHQVWLPPLAPAITLDQVGVPPISAAPTSLSVILGQLDRPAEQRKEPFTLDLAGAQGNIAIVGAPQSGKSTLVRTLVTSLALTYRPHQAAFYCIDLGGGALAGASDLPHVGTVADRLEPELLRRMVAEVHNLLRAREQRFRDGRIDSAATMRSRRAAGALPDEPLGDVFLVIDGWGTLRQEFEDLEPLVTDIAARGLGYAIHVVLTASRWAEIRAALQNSIGERVELRLADPFDSLVDRKASGRLTKAPTGRGITADGLQFQTALPRYDGQTRIDDLRETADKLVNEIARAWTGPTVPPIRILPAHVDYAAMPTPGSDRYPGAPIGLSSAALEPAYLDVLGNDSHLLVFGDTESGKTNALRATVTALAARHVAAELMFVIVDYRRTLLEVVGADRTLAYAGSAPAAAQTISEVAAGFAQRLPGADVTPAQLRARNWWKGPEIVIVVDDYDLVAGTNNPLDPLLPYLPQARDVGLHLLLARRSGGAARALYDPIIQRVRELGCTGLILSGDRSEGPLLGGVAPVPQPAGRGILVRRRQPPDIIQTCWLAPPD